MPGYGIESAESGTGLLSWAWAEQRLAASRNYWLVTTWPDGRPHAMPVWAVWHAGALWFSCGKDSRKVRNLDADPRCVLTTEDASNPVVLEGVAELVTEQAELELLLRLENAKYNTDYGMDMLSPDFARAYRVRPRWAFGLESDDFTGSPTRWTFEP
jgi:PPOX class probable F420-dependent enzyme